MNLNKLTQLVEELEGKMNLGFGEDALSLCRQILDEAQVIDSETFRLLCRSIGMFADDFSPWMDSLSARFQAMGKQDKAGALPIWIFFMLAANVEWEQVKPYVALDKLSDEIIPQVCFSAIEANEKVWCKKALKTLERIDEESGDLLKHGIAQAALQSATGNYLAALRALEFQEVKAELFEDVFAILTTATIKYYLQALDDLETRISGAEKLLDLDTDISLPGNDRERFKELHQAISQAADAAAKLIKDLMVKHSI